jgi:DNA-binding PadR family transcriptional regulator
VKGSALESKNDSAADDLAKIYYFIPSIRESFTLGSTSIDVREPMDAVLWLLKIIQDEGDSSQRRLFKMLSRSFPTLDLSRFSRLLHETYRKGLVSREWNEVDNRLKILRLTPMGEKVVNKIKARRAALLDELFEDLSSSEKKILLKALHRLAEHTWRNLSASR